MIDIQLIRRDSDFIAKALLKRGVKFDKKKFADLEESRKELQVKTEALQKEKNQIAKKIGEFKASGESAESLLARASMIPKDLDQLNKELTRVQNQIQDWLSSLPNLPHDDVPDGDSEEFNQEIRKCGEIPDFSFKPKDHSEVGFDLGLDFESAAKYDKKHIDARLRIAAILHDGEDINSSVIAWRKVLDIDPEHRLARRRLQESVDRQEILKQRISPKG